MPVMDGVTATAEFRRRGVRIPIVGLTANADDETRSEAMKAGMDELLTKPVSMATLANLTSRYRRRPSQD